MGPFWIPFIIRHLLFRVPKKRAIILTTAHVYRKMAPQPSQVFLQLVPCLLQTFCTWLSRFFDVVLEPPLLKLLGHCTAESQEDVAKKRPHHSGSKTSRLTFRPAL